MEKQSYKEFYVQDQLPTDPEELLRYGQQIISKAFVDKAEILHHEIERLTSLLKERDVEITNLKEKVTTFRYELEQKSLQISQLNEEKSQFLREKQQMNSQLKKMQRDLTKLHSFKKAIVQSLNSQDEISGFDEQILAMAERPASTKPSESPIYMAQPIKISTETASYGAEKETPTNKGRMMLPDPMSPTSERDDDDDEYDQTTRMEGKEFFKMAKEELSYQQFNEFLTCIRKLNDHSISRNQALATAKDIFGPKQNLYLAFKSLLSRHEN